MSVEPNLAAPLLQVDCARADVARGAEEGAQKAKGAHADVLRGSRLSVALTHAQGLLWTRSPLDYAPSERAQLWELSAPVTKLGAFLSHSWQSPGWQKRLALMVHFYWRTASAVGKVVAVALFLLDVAGALPTMEGDYLTSVRFCPWSVVPCAAMLAAIFLVPWCVACDRWVFLDVTCIHQYDEELKLKGIYSLSEFLSVSDELIVLWTPPYFERLWCVYEVAMFTSSSGHRTLTWCPPCLRLLALALLCFWTFSACTDVFYASSVLSVDADFQAVATLSFLIWMCGGYLLVRLAREMAWDKKLLIAQMESFDCSMAACRDEEDRSYIEEGIRRRWDDKEAFNAYVRGPLKAAAHASVQEAWALDLSICIDVCMPMVWESLQYVAAFTRTNRSWSWFAFMSATTVVRFALWPFAFCKALLFLADRLARPRSNRVAETAVNVLVLFLATLVGTLLNQALLAPIAWYEGVASVSAW